MPRILWIALLLNLVACSGSDPTAKKKAASEEKKQKEEQPVVLVAPQLSASSGIGQITLLWNAVEGATEYVVKRADTAEGAYSIIGTLAEKTYTDANLTAGTTFYYKVNAKNAEGDGPESTVASAKVLYPLAPAPATVSVVSGDQSARIYWAAANGALNYEIMRARDGVTVSAGKTVNTNFTDAALMNGRQYTYFVRSLNEDNAPNPSTAVSVMPYLYGRQLCVSSSQGNDIHVFSADATGVGTPIRTLSGPSSITNPVDIAWDAGNQAILVLDGSSKHVVSFSASTRAETRRLRGAWTSPTAITVDTTRGELWVADGDGSVYAYPVTDAGAGTVLRTLTTGQTGLLDVALDTVHGEIFTANSTSAIAWPVTGSTQLRRYPYSSGGPGYGAFTQLRTIAYIPDVDTLVTGERQTSTSSRLSRMKRCHDTFGCSRAGTLLSIISSSGNGSPDYTDIVFSRSDQLVYALSGKTYYPQRMYSFSSVNFQQQTTHDLSAPESVIAVALDPAGTQFWLAGDDYVHAYDLSWVNPDPIGALGSSGISIPERLASDPINQELYVFNAGTGSISVFPWTASGAVTPPRTVIAANGWGFTGEILYVPAKERLFAVANRNVLASIPRTTNGSLDLMTVDRSSEGLSNIFALAYDPIGDQVIAHAQDTFGSEFFYFWQPTLGSALGVGNDGYSVSHRSQSLLFLEKLYLFYWGTFFKYQVNGTSVSTAGPSITTGYTSERTTMIRDEKNNKIFVGQGGRIYVFSDPLPVGALTHERELNVSANVGTEVTGMAFCSE